jgi:glycosyltransferase involved in cell wall biosynthesis
MPVYNGSKHLSDAVDSILTQTYTNFEFLIIDDASTDNSFEILKSYKDDRIRLIKNEKNIGLSASLNKGLNLALGKYIARMDQDDISLPNRLEKQIEYFKEHNDICV